MKNNLTFEIVSYEETNPAYDWRFCGNGGGYHQPFIEIAVSDGRKVAISDSSCGDFGWRYSIQLFTGDEEVEAEYSLNQVDYNSDGGFPLPDWDSTFTDNSFIKAFNAFMREEDLPYRLDSQARYREELAEALEERDREQEEYYAEEAQYSEEHEGESRSSARERRRG